MGLGGGGANCHCQKMIKSNQVYFDTTFLKKHESGVFTRQLLNKTYQSQIQDFPKEGARFRVKCHVDAIQWGGGGVVAEIFRDLKNNCAIRWGGGVVAQNFPLPQNVILR